MMLSVVSIDMMLSLVPVISSCFLLAFAGSTETKRDSSKRAAVRQR